MSGLFIFAETMTEEGCQCLVIMDDPSETEGSLKFRFFKEIASLAQDYHVTLVLPQIRCSLHSLELPWLTEKKARLAIPFALEDSIAQPMETLHFAFSKSYYAHHRYLILTCERTLLHALLEQLKAAGIHPTNCTSDWFALPQQSLALSPDYLLMNTEEFKGELPYHLHDFIPNTEEITVFGFNDTPATNTIAVSTPVSQSFREWVAKELSQREGVNLLQGEFAKTTHNQWHRRLYKVSAILAVIWLISIFSVNSWLWYKYHQKNQNISAKIETLYRQFFPQATQVINPRFRISQALKNTTDTPNTSLWKLLTAITLSLDDTSVIINALQYRNNRVIINVKADTFEKLEQLQDALKRLSIKVQQSNASTSDQQVTANLELSV